MFCASEGHKNLGTSSVGLKGAGFLSQSCRSILRSPNSLDAAHDDELREAFPDSPVEVVSYFSEMNVTM